MGTIKYVQISPFYCGCGWYDYLSGINFAKTRKNEPIAIPEGTNLTNIRKYIARNLLVDVTAKYDRTVKVEEDNKEILARSLAGMSSNVILKDEAYDAAQKDVTVEEVVEVSQDESVEEVCEEPNVEEVEATPAENVEVVEKPITKASSKKNKSRK